MKKLTLTLALLFFISAAPAPEVKNHEYTDKEGNVVRISILDKNDIHKEVVDEDAPKLILYTLQHNLLNKYPDATVIDKKKIDNQYFLVLKVVKEGQQTLTVAYLSYVKNDKVVTIGYLVPNASTDTDAIEQKLTELKKNLD